MQTVRARNSAELRRCEIRAQQARRLENSSLLARRDSMAGFGLRRHLWRIHHFGPENQALEVVDSPRRRKGRQSMSNISHLGQPVGNHVVLEAVGVASTGDPSKDLDFFRILPDGTMTPGGPAGFRVPTGGVLVITDVDWQYSG